MGDHFSIKTAVWTIWFLCCSVLSSDLEVPEELGIESSEDTAAKANISQGEYTRMMGVYLAELGKTEDPENVPQLLTFKSERKSWRRTGDGLIRIKFPVKPPNEDLEVQSADLRILVPPSTKDKAIKVKVFQILSKRRKRLVDEGVVYLTSEGPKWSDFDVTTAIQSWIAGERNLGLGLECVNHRPLRLLEVAMNALVLPVAAKRSKRAAFKHSTDCKTTDQPNCCRSSLIVSFKGLQYKHVVQPRSFDAGVCRGVCPDHYNPSSNHTHIKLLMSQNNTNVPKPCCVGSKFEAIGTLQLQADARGGLVLKRWENMRVVTCVCS